MARSFPKRVMVFSRDRWNADGPGYYLVWSSFGQSLCCLRGSGHLVALTIYAPTRDSSPPERGSVSSRVARWTHLSLSASLFLDEPRMSRSVSHVPCRIPEKLPIIFFEQCCFLLPTLDMRDCASSDASLTRAALWSVL